MEETQCRAPKQQPGDRRVAARACDDQIRSDLASHIGDLVRGLRSDVIDDLESGTWWQTENGGFLVDPSASYAGYLKGSACGHGTMCRAQAQHDAD